MKDGVNEPILFRVRATERKVKDGRKAEYRREGKRKEEKEKRRKETRERRINRRGRRRRKGGLQWVRAKLRPIEREKGGENEKTKNEKKKRAARETDERMREKRERVRLYQSVSSERRRESVHRCEITRV